MEKTYKVFDIKWDIDNDDEVKLPTSIFINIDTDVIGVNDEDELIEHICETLSDIYGYTHEGFLYMEMSKEKIYILNIIDEGRIVITKASKYKQNLIDFIEVYFRSHGYIEGGDIDLLYKVQNELKIDNISDITYITDEVFKITESEMI